MDCTDDYKLRFIRIKRVHLALHSDKYTLLNPEKRIKFDISRKVVVSTAMLYVCTRVLDILMKEALLMEDAVNNIMVINTS